MDVSSLRTGTQMTLPRGGGPLHPDTQNPASHPQLEPGRLEFTIAEGVVLITHADPVIECPGEWLERVCNWGIGKWNTPLAHGPNHKPDKLSIDMVTFSDAANQQIVYRIKEYDLVTNIYTLAWPD
jgi:hypothetical protein